jgi:hypothetical protein
MTLATYSAFAIAAHETHEIRPADRQLAQSAVSDGAGVSHVDALPVRAPITGKSLLGEDPARGRPR